VRVERKNVYTASMHCNIIVSLVYEWSWRDSNSRPNIFAI